MSDQAMKAEFADRIDRLSELVEAERELRAAMSNFEEAQRAVVQSAERLQDWADRWDDCRQRVLSVVADDDLTTQKATEYKLSDANDVMRRFCDEVELKREAIAALSVPEVAEVEIPEGYVKWEGGECPVKVGDSLRILWREGVQSGTFVVDDVWATQRAWEPGAHDDDIIAYRVLPIEPAAAKGETFAETVEKLRAVTVEHGIKLDPDGYQRGDDDYPDFTEEQTSAIESATAKYQSTDGAEIVSGEPWPEPTGEADLPDLTGPEYQSNYAPITIASSSQHAEESARAQDLAPLFPPEPPQAATPESLRAGGIVDSEASYWAGKLTTAQAGHVRKGWTL